MANSNQQDAQARRQQQYELQRILARYQHEYHTGKSPRIEAYVQQYPQFAAELIDFAFYFHTIAADLPEPGATPAATLSPAAEKALVQIKAAEPEPEATPAAGESAAAAEAPAQISTQPAPTISGLFQQGLDAGYAPPELAESLGISWDVLAKLEAHAISVTSIPRTLIQRIAGTLSVLPETILAYLREATAGQAGTFYYADQPPTQQQETFLEAIQASPELSSQQKGEWAKIVEQEVAGA
ncbi:MAG TPA: hypothetical protein VFU32_09490 [Ktedonobacterales bacterium]|nr:hypothetical protein [Ktedonobacterales bacterium]